MTEELGSANYILGADVSGFTSGTAQADRSAIQHANIMTAMGNQTSGSMAKMGVAMGVGLAATAKMLDGITKLATGLKDFVASSVSVSARVSEMNIVLENLAKQNGYTSQEINAAVKSVKALGITSTSAQQAVAQLVRYNIDLASASKLARVAQDAAVLSQSNSSETLDRLIYGVSTMNNRVLRTAGLMVQAGASTEKYAKSLGKATDDLTETERIQAMLNEVLEAGTKITGTYEAAMTSAGKQARSLPRYIEEVQEAIGNRLYGAYTVSIKAQTEFWKGMQEATQAGQPLANALDDIASILASVTPMVLDLVSRGIKAGIPALASFLQKVVDLAIAFTNLPAPLQAGIAATVLFVAKGHQLADVALLAANGIKFLGATVVGLAGATVIGAAVVGIALLIQGLAEWRAQEQSMIAQGQELVQSTYHRGMSWVAYRQEIGRVEQATGQMAASTTQALQEFFNANGIEANASMMTWEKLRQIYPEVASNAEFLARAQDLLYEAWQRQNAVMDVAAGKTNIAQAGLERLAQKLQDPATATEALAQQMAKFGDGIEQVGEQVGTSMASAVEAVVDFGEKLRESFAKAGTEGIQGLAQAVQKSTDTMTGLLDNFRQSQYLSEIDYQATRAEYVRRGDEKAVAQLDNHHAKERVLAERQYAIQTRLQEIQNAKEIELARKKFGELLAIQVVEMAKQNKISRELANEALTTIAKATGAEIAINWFAADEFLKALEAKEKGQRLFGYNYEETLEGMLEAAMRFGENVGKALAGEPLDVGALFKGIGGVSGATDVATEVAGAEKEVKNVAADMASTVNRMMDDILSIGEKLKQQVPEIPAEAIKLWLDQLYQMAVAMREWLTSPEKEDINAFLDHFDQELTPKFEKLNAASSVLSSLLGDLQSISQHGAQEALLARRSVKAQLDALMGLTREAGEWMQANGTELAAMADWWDRDLRPIFERWQKGLEPFIAILGHLRSAEDATAEETKLARRSLYSVLDELKNLTIVAGVWMNKNGVEMDRIVRWWEKDLNSIMYRWGAALAALLAPLGQAKTITEALEVEAENTTIKLEQALNRSAAMLGTAYAWYVRNEPWLISITEKMEPYRKYMELFAIGLAAVTPVIQLQAAIAQVQAQQIGEAEASLWELMDKSLALYDAAVRWLSANIGLLANSTALMEPYRRYLDLWNKDLQAVVAVVKVGNDIAAAQAYEAKEAKQNLQQAMAASLDYLVLAVEWLEANGDQVKSMTERMKSYTQSLERWVVGLRLVGEVMGLGIGLNAALSAKIQKQRTDLADWLWKSLDMATKGAVWLEQNETEWQAVARKMADYKDRLAEYIGGLKQLLDVVTTTQKLNEGLGVSYKQSAVSMGEWFVRAEEFLQQSIAWLETGNNADQLEALVDELTEYKDTFTDLNTTLGLLRAMVDSTVAINTALSNKAAGLSGVGFEEVLDNIGEWIIAVLAKLRSIEGQYIAQQLDKETVDTMTAIESAVKSAASVVENGIKSIRMIRLYRGGAMAGSLGLDQFGKDLMTLLVKMKEVEQEFVLKGQDVNKDFAAGVESMVKTALGGLQFLALLGKTPQNTATWQIEEFARSLGKLLTALSVEFGKLDTEGVDWAQLKQTGEDAGPAITMLGTAFEIITQMPGKAMPDAHRFDTLVGLMGSMIKSLAQLEISEADAAAIANISPVLAETMTVYDQFAQLMDHWIMKPGKAATSDTKIVAKRMKELVTGLIGGDEGLAAQMAAHPEWKEVSPWLVQLGNGMQSLINAVSMMSSVALPQATNVGLTALRDFVTEAGQIDGTPAGAKIVSSIVDGLKSKEEEVRAQIAVILALLAQLGIAQGVLADAGYDGPAPGGNTPAVLGAMAEGGMVWQKGPYMLAENGPEIVLPMDKLESMFGGAVLDKVGMKLTESFVRGMAMGIDRQIPVLDKALDKIARRMIPHSPIPEGPLQGMGGVEDRSSDLNDDTSPDWRGRWLPGVDPGPSGSYTFPTPEPMSRTPRVGVQVGIQITGPVSIRSDDDLSKLAALIDQRISQRIPQISNAVSGKIAQDTRTRTRFGVTQ